MNNSGNEILKSAIGCEYDAEKLYRSLSEQVEDQEAKVILQKIADEELQHAQILEGLLEKSDENLIPSNVAINNKKAGPTQLPLASNASVEEVLHFAIEAEVEACETYSMLASIARTQEIKESLEELATMELGHKKQLEKLL